MQQNSLPCSFQCLAASSKTYSQGIWQRSAKWFFCFEQQEPFKSALHSEDLQQGWKVQNDVITHLVTVETCAVFVVLL